MKRCYLNVLFFLRAVDYILKNWTKEDWVNWMTACHNHKKNIESVGQYHLLANEYTVRVLKILFEHKCYEEMDFKV